MLISDDVLFNMEEKDLIEKYLRGSALALPVLSDSDKEHLQEGASVAVELIQGERSVSGSFVVQVIEALLPRELGNPECNDKVRGYICHLAMFDFDSFSFVPRPIVSFAVHESDLAETCGNKDEIYAALYDTLAEKIEKLAQSPDDTE